MTLKEAGGIENGNIQSTKPESTKECFEALAGIQPAKAIQHPGKTNRVIHLPRALPLVGVEFFYGGDLIG